MDEVHFELSRQMNRESSCGTEDEARHNNSENSHSEEFYNTDANDIAYFITQDEILACLDKAAHDARQRQEKLKTENGLDDAMYLISIDVTDSAISAFETRLIELRKQTETEEERAVFEATRNRFVRRRLADEARATLTQRNKRKEKEKSHLDFVMFMWLWMTCQTLWAARHYLSVREDFGHATLNHRVIFRGAAG